MTPIHGVLLIALVPLAVGLMRFTRMMRMRSWPTARATVTGSEQRSRLGRATDSVTFEKLEFTTADGRRVRTSPAHGYYGLRSRVGRTVTVHYDPDDPHHVLAPNTPLTHSGFVLILVGLPLAALVAWAFTRTL